MSRPSSRNSLHLEPPRKSVELIDSGARELQSSEGEDEYFSDASEGRRRSSRPVTPASPVPKTRIEKVDDAPRHGEVPGTPAYMQRTQDAVPDEVEVVPEGRSSRRSSQLLEPQNTPGDTVIPRTVVEKIDPSVPSHGDVPGTPAYMKRQADAAPDAIFQRSESVSDQGSSERTIADIPIPETVVTRVDSIPAHGEVEGTAAYEKRKMDASPDVIERETGSNGWPTSDRSLGKTDGPSSPKFDFDLNEDHQNVDRDEFGDDFDDFEESGQPGIGADEDFGDFDDGFQGPNIERVESEHKSLPEANSIPTASFPLIDTEILSSIPDLLTATEMHLDAMFPFTTREKLSSLPEPDSIDESSPIFHSERSRSLWKQLITPPSLQPPNWTQSRIRRRFLVSLGVPVDLDEILPPSKQRKLVLPDINLDASTQKSDKAMGSVARLKMQAGNDSTGSVDSVNSTGAKDTKSARNRRTKGPPPPPDLDLIAVKRLCATTDEKIDGLTDVELQAHVKSLEDMTEQTSVLLEYWLKRRDGLRKEKEAFEGVIENLVQHARRVRK